jgi:hypothetical protein
MRLRPSVHEVIVVGASAGIGALLALFAYGAQPAAPLQMTNTTTTSSPFATPVNPTFGGSTSSTTTPTRR